LNSALRQIVLALGARWLNMVLRLGKSFAAEPNVLANEEDNVRREFRDKWKSNPIYDGVVEFIGDSRGQGSSPKRVRLGTQGHPAFAKLAISAASEPEGAHEYVASELAYLIDVSVPPVGFWFDDTGNKFVLSVRAYREMAHWDEVQISDADRQALLPLFSASAVFHTWIADVDHCGHPDNLMIDAASADGDPRVSLLTTLFP